MADPEKRTKSSELCFLTQRTMSKTKVKFVTGEFIKTLYELILMYISNKMYMLQSLFYLTTALHVSGVIITHLQEHKTNVTTASSNRYRIVVCCYRGRGGTDLSVFWVAYPTHNTLKSVPTLPR
jgi:hypothetical protein